MSINPQFQLQSVQESIELVWDKLSKQAVDMGDNVHFWEWTPGVGMYGIIKAYENTKQQRYADFIEQWAEANAIKIKFGSVNWVIPANALLNSHQLNGN